MANATSMTTVTLNLTPEQSLFHGSPTLFEAPYLPRNIENRFSCETKFPLYYATKSCSTISPGEGYLYEYKISEWAKKEHGGIPNFLHLQGNIHESMKHYIDMMLQEPEIHHFTDDEIRRNMPYGFMSSRVNSSQNDLELACVCRTKYNGIYVPGYENQLLICGRGRPQWLEIHNIFKVVKGKDGKITSTLFQTFPDFFSEPAKRSGTPVPSENRSCNLYEGDKLSLEEIFGEDIFKNDKIETDSSSGYNSSIGDIDHMFNSPYNSPTRKNEERKEGEPEIPVDVWEQICTRTVVEKTTVINGKKVRIDVDGATPRLPKPIRISDTLTKGSVFKQSTLKTGKSIEQKHEELSEKKGVWSGKSYGTDSWDTGSWHNGGDWRDTGSWGNGGDWHNGGWKTKWNDKNVDKFDEEVNTGVDPIIKFYRNEAVNKAKRRLSTIWNWSDEKLESQHDFIQWIFPLIEKSRFNYDAPVLTKRSIEILRTDREIQENIKVSFDKMFAFYGWKVNETLDGVERMTIEVEKDGEVEKKLKPMEWLRHSHNFDRITRIMTSLKLLGRTDLSELFFMALCRTAKGPNARKIIASSFIEYWLPTQEHFLPTNVLEAYCTDITDRRKKSNRIDSFVS
ncbi:MAG: opioid growth factor receptor-related protein [Candidatus Colwellbacteria bacterium]|nr:opioid growth factor receptor-related protein [Candidatus Colwellbacteria bacterium]